jgi:hypothetical protein
MNRPVSYIGSANKNLDRVMEPEQFNQVIEAILDGKYSWACVLILRFAGYNPLHFIPYRTYNRLVKDNSSPKSFNRNLPNSTHQQSLEHETDNNLSSTKGSHSSLHTIQDLAYLENHPEPPSKIVGGWRFWPIV